MFLYHITCLRDCSQENLLNNLGESLEKYIRLKHSLSRTGGMQYAISQMGILLLKRAYAIRPYSGWIFHRKNERR